MRALSAIALATSLFAMPLTASATGGVWCDATDTNLDFHFKAVMSRDGTGPWFDIIGNLQTKFGTLPKPIAAFDIKNENLTQRWLDGDLVLLQVQAYDADAINTVMLTVTTKDVDEAVYKGSYELRISANDGENAYVTKTGKVSCSAD